MQHKLLGSTALASAGLLFASVAPVQAQGIELTLSGFTEFGLNAATDETFAGGPDRGYDAFMDNEVFVRAQGTSDGGTTYGSTIELEVGSGAGPGAENAFIDEAVLFFSGGFGRIELGRDDGAEDVMFVGGEDTQAGTGGFDGDAQNLAPLQIQDSGDAAKVTYFTPRVGGFQAGATWTPDHGDDGGDDTGGDFENTIGAGVNWTGDFAGTELIVAATGIFGDAETGGADDLADWSVGTRVIVAGLRFGAAYIMRTDANEADIFNVGLGFGIGPVSASVGYVFFDPDGGEEQNVFAVSGTLGVLPGVALKGDIAYNDNDPGALPVGEETWAGVLAIQLNY